MEASAGIFRKEIGKGASEENGVHGFLDKPVDDQGPEPGLAAFRIRNLCFSYGNALALDDVSVDVPRGKITVFIGPNGSGKSTLLRCMNNQLKPVSGQIACMDRPASSYKRNERARTIAFLPQSPKSVEGLQVWELVARGRFPHLPVGLSMREGDWDIVDRSITVMGLEKMAGRRLGELSGGEVQRVWLAMVLCQDTPIICLDEPLSHLDLLHQWKLLENLAYIRDGFGRSIIAVMHEISPAAAIADHVVAMNRGRVVLEGTANEVFDSGELERIFGLPVLTRKETGMVRRPSVTLFT